MISDNNGVAFGKNCSIIASIIKTTEICGRRGIALRGKEICWGIAIILKSVFVFEQFTYLK